MSNMHDMYAQSPRTAGPRAEGIHIRQTYIIASYVMFPSVKPENYDLQAPLFYSGLTRIDYGL